MATEKQIEANRRNAALSTGPKTEAGKALSRANATTHGLAAEHPEAESSPAFLDRRAKWGAELRPSGEVVGWALDRAVAASLRIDSCGRAMDVLIAKTRERARLVWDEDRGVEAAETFTRLARNPVLAARQLRATLAGALLLMEAWAALGQALHDRDWDEAEASRALDLLGVARDLRQGRTAIDPVEGDGLAFRRELVAGEVEGLKDLIERALIPLEQGECRRAMAGDLALISKPGKLLARYERDAWRTYHKAMAEVANPSTVPVAVAPPVPEVPAVAEDRASEVGPDALLAEAIRVGFLPAGAGDESDWIAAMERQLAAMERSEGSRVGTNPISRGELIPA